MTVSVDGEVRYRWRVSTGATGFSTPVGSYTPFRMEVMHLLPRMGQRRHAPRDLLHHERAQHPRLR
ncbi:MAG TPA: L,D-transpeptidase, partial [Methyloceanibacter sp.]|nr:L,D-transpeptidase [Methyloceanibacter sp.]